MGDQLLLVNRRVGAALPAYIGGVVRQRLPQGLDNADIVHNQPVAFPFRHAICARDGLHQGVGLQRLVQIQAGQALDIKARQPHGAHEYHSQRIVRVLEFLVQLALFHLLAMRLDVESPFLEGLNLVLLLADDHRHFGFFHPCQFAVQLLRLLLGSVPDFAFQPGDFLRPVVLNHIVHAHAGHFVQADKHRFSAGPQVAVMAHKVPGDGFQPGSGRQQMYFLCKFPLQLFLLVHVQIRLLDGIQNPVGDFRVMQVGDLVPAVLVIQRHRRAVLHRSLEVIHGNVAAKGARGQVVIRQKRRSRKADARGRGQQFHHIGGKDAVLAAMRLVGHNQNVVIGIDGLRVGLVEFLNQGKDKARVAL